MRASQEKESSASATKVNPLKQNMIGGDPSLFVETTGTPDALLNPKKKIFEQVQLDLRTNEEGVACYKGAPFTVAGKGVCRSQTMKGTGIK